MVDRRERFRGALLGLACGDALGAAVEGWPRPDIAAAFGTLRDFQTGPIWAHGETTDDTAQAVDLAESLLATAEFDPDDLMRRFVAWLRTGGKGIGITTHAALSAYIGGAGASDAARVAHDSTGGLSAGNGGLMRAAPVALRHAADPAAIADVACRQTAVTHFDPLAGHAAAAFCLGLDALLADGGPRDAHARAVECARAASPELSERLAHAAEHEPNPNGYGGFAPRTLEAAFWALLHADHAEDAVVRAVNLGGDNDTHGAVAGALAGAWQGGGALPSRWLDGLQDRARLVELADRLLATS